MAAQSNYRTLLRGGTLLVHDDESHVQPTCADLLIVGNTIARIQKNILLEEEDAAKTTIIDCRGKIICPGFISTHHHLYQTPMKGQHANHTLLEYFPTGNFTASLYSLADAFWGELGGALEAIDAGTTTVVDHSSLNLSPEYPKTTLRALASSGLRAIYAYCSPRIVQSWSPLKWTDDYSSDWVLDSFNSLAKDEPIASGRVRLGFAVDNLYLPAEEISALYARIRSAGAKVITSHAVGGLSFGNPPSAVQILAQHGLLGPDILLSHANFPKDGDAELLRTAGAWVSSTPNTELQMGMPPVALQAGFSSQASLGVDCHSWGSGFIPGQMRLLLQWARCQRAEDLAAAGEWSRHVGFGVEEVFNLGTVGGARAVGMSDEIGRIQEGFKADLVVFGTQSPGMLVAAVESPVAAVVLHSNERDVEMVIVDGVVRKQEGHLIDVVTAPPVGGGPTGLGVEEGERITWDDVAGEVLSSRERLKQKMLGIDWDAAEEVTLDRFHYNRKSMVEAVNSGDA
ncbi:Amidohydrolase family protein [Pleurostoma richardsiae]|uniref:Amidohydrolase family protein n=1 Tax=Pleurostoma richardsiae TaxID=41990 RepID=A0AA38RDW4_9PEZI|nr:Amidohydrolase family protein [Pleurostoma richardsiae]